MAAPKLRNKNSTKIRREKERERKKERKRKKREREGGRRTNVWEEDEEKAMKQQVGWRGGRTGRGRTETERETE